MIKYRRSRLNVQSSGQPMIWISGTTSFVNVMSLGRKGFSNYMITALAIWNNFSTISAIIQFLWFTEKRQHLIFPCQVGQI